MSAETPPPGEPAPTAGPTLGAFLRDRRARLAPAPGASARRRTPGLRREEVATRAGVSITWYTWLEQGRGGPPSDEVLERLVAALELDAAGRELLFLLARQRRPPVVASPVPPVPPGVQRMMDAMPFSPAFVKTPTWDIVAWNAAAEAVFPHVGAADGERNLLRRMFLEPGGADHLLHPKAVARFALAVFRVDVARAGAGEAAQALIDELAAGSAEFRRLWAENEVASHGAGAKQIRHPQGGALAMEFAAFSIDGAEGLSLIVYTPATAADARAVEALVARRAQAAA